MKEKQCDVVVLGGGGSGLTAAVRAAQLSGKKVIVVEKAPRTGGGMIMASTMRTFRSRWQAERGLPDVTNNFLRQVMDATYWRLDPALASNAVLATGQFFDWFCELAGEEVGDRFRVGRYVFDGEDGPLGPQLGGPGGVTGGGRLFMDTLLKQCDAFGIEVLTRHRALYPEMENGSIAAVIAEGSEGKLRIRCKACILATGSWINNPDVMGEAFPQFLETRPSMDMSPHMNPNYTGDGFAFAEAADAMTDRKNFTLRMMGPMVFSQSGTIAHMGQCPYSLMVDGQGKRFICEDSESRIGPFNSGLVMMEKTRGISYILFDTAALETAVSENARDPQPSPHADFGIPALPLAMPAALEDIENAITKEANRVFRADTPEELAALTGIEPQALLSTIERYNQYCQDGFDRECFKDPKNLIPFVKAPYYAIRAKIGTDGAFGGIQVNENMQAYRADGSLIDGLYVTGDFASGRFINMTGVKVQLLNDMSWALASGFLAGTDVCRYLSGGHHE